MKKTMHTDPDLQNLRATPEVEDFAHKYTEEGQGKIGSKLLEGYFKAVSELFSVTDLSKAKAIEIGCGEGFSTLRLQKFLPKGVALSASEYVAELVPKAKKNNPGVTVIQESVYETTHKNNTFDLVFLLEVLEHLDYPEKALEELARVTKPGGYLILGVPHEPLWCALNMARGKYLRHLGNTPGHLNHWTTTGLIRFVRKNFGEVVEVKTPLPWTIVLAKKS